MEITERKYCPFIQSNTGFPMNCLEHKCMAWRAVDDDMDTGEPIYDCVLLSDLV